MKSFLRLFAVSALLAPAALFAAAFEGTVNFKVTSSTAKGASQINQSIKGDKVRMVFPDQKGIGAMIMDGTKKEMLMIMDEQRMYMTMAVPEFAEKSVENSRNDTKLEKTDMTEKILGYTATKYVATSRDGTKSDMWLAEGLGTFMGLGNNQNPMAGGGRRGAASGPQGWEKELMGKNLFPLRVVGLDKAGKETFRMEVTAIEKQKLPDSLFLPPEGYQKFDMGGMMKGMIPGFGR